MSSFSSQRERFQARRQGQKRRGWIWWVLVIAALAAVIVYLVLLANRPPYGEAFPILDSSHVPEGTDPGPYNSDPPTSGHHYERELPRGFYEDSDLADMGPFPVGHVVHNLEHGYIVFWYNCDSLSAAECDALKTQIRDYIANSSVRKLVAFPWHSIDIPLVLTSWGYRLEMPVFDANEANQFINSNRLRAPEPNAE